MPVNFALIIQLFRRALREASPRRRKVLRFLVVVTPFFIALNQLCLLLDHLLFPGFRRVRVQKPVFIIGHARSGTSLLHRLMCGDDQSFSWVMMYEMLLPSILQRKLVRAIARLDARWLGARLATRVHAWEDRVFAKGRQMHPMNLDGPEEDEFLLTLTFYSATVAMIFPYIGAQLDGLGLQPRADCRGAGGDGQAEHLLPRGVRAGLQRDPRRAGAAVRGVSLAVAGGQRSRQSGAGCLKWH